MFMGKWICRCPDGQQRQAAIAALVLFILFAKPAMSPGQAADSGFSFGQGLPEIYLFTDYFCPPCQSIEPYMESVLPRLSSMGARITFVDMPIHEQTPLYARYYLYAARKANNIDEVLRIRHALFDMAKSKVVVSEREMMTDLKQKAVSLSYFDTQPAFTHWNELIDRFKVISTPTCIVVQPGQETLSFAGSEAIREGIDPLLQRLSTASTNGTGK
jgi:thiol:disulfide interchange protein DsbA